MLASSSYIEQMIHPPFFDKTLGLTILHDYVVPYKMIFSNVKHIPHLACHLEFGPIFNGLHCQIQTCIIPIPIF